MSPPHRGGQDAGELAALPSAERMPRMLRLLGDTLLSALASESGTFAARPTIALHFRSCLNRDLLVLHLRSAAQEDTTGTQKVFYLFSTVAVLRSPPAVVSSQACRTGQMTRKSCHCGMVSGTRRCSHTTSARWHLGCPGGSAKTWDGDILSGRAHRLAASSLRADMWSARRQLAHAAAVSESRTTAAGCGC